MGRLLSFRSLSVSLFLMLILVACKKETDTSGEVVPVYSFSAPDSLVFEHSSIKTLKIKVNGESNTGFAAKLNNVPAFFGSYGELQIPSNEEREYQIEFNQFSAVPNSYPIELSVFVPNINLANTQNKTIQLIYRPNCGYSFKNYVNADITYTINGLLENKSVTCSYESDGRFKVTGLVPFEMIFTFDCGAQSFTMAPVTHLGEVKTCLGAIQGQNLVYEIYSNGALSATGKIQP